MSAAVVPVPWKPRTWIAVTLGATVAPLAFLYLERAWWAGLFLLFAIAAGTLNLLAPNLFGTGWGWPLIQFAVFAAGTALAYRTAKHATATGSRRWYSRWPALSGIGLVVVATVMLIRLFFYEPFRAPSTAMLPTVKVGDNFIVQKWGYGHYSIFGMTLSSRPISAALHRGDILVFDFPFSPAQTYIKRLIGLPGDMVEYRDHHVFLNGKDTRTRQSGEYLDEQRFRYLERFSETMDGTDYEIVTELDHSPYPAARDFTFKENCRFSVESIVCRVPAAYYFVLGDNRDNSLDSRQWGFVRSDQIIGRVVRIFH